MYRHTDAEYASRFPPWAEGAYYQIPVPLKEFAQKDEKTKQPIANDKAYVLKNDGKVELVKVDYFDYDMVKCIVLAENKREPGEKKNKWEPVSSRITKRVYLTRPKPKVRGIEVDSDDEYYEELMSEMPKWTKPRFYYPAYLLETGGSRKRRANRTRRTKRSQNL